MLEVLRVLSQEDLPLMYNVIFLFNGAEENLLQVRIPCLISLCLSYATLNLIFRHVSSGLRFVSIVCFWNDLIM